MKIKLVICLLITILTALPGVSYSQEALRVLTWEGYVLPEEAREVNKILKEKGYEFKVEIITPYAEGAEQMFGLLRQGKCDISFLTLFFIKMQAEKTTRLLQPININSPRLTNYKHLNPSLTHIPMGMEGSNPLYIPWGGGAYGFYADMKKLKESEVPTSVKDFWDPKWKGKFSLNISQPWYNIGLALLSMGKPPFYINDLALAGKRKDAINLSKKDGALQKNVTALYKHAGHFWKSAPEFKEDLFIVSSWGPEVTRENSKGGKWKMIKFKEGNMVWLDTINFAKGISGKKLKAAEIFANYFIGKKVQNRVVNKLSMVAASSLTDSNPLAEGNSAFFLEKMFVPPYNRISDNLMQKISSRALAARGK